MSFGSLAFAQSTFAAGVLRAAWEPIVDVSDPAWTDILRAATIVNIEFGDAAFASAPFASSISTNIAPSVGVWTVIDNTQTPPDPNWQVIVT